jgi:hypothetical protein
MSAIFIKDNDLQALLTKAIKAGDLETVKLCKRAFKGETWAKVKCAAAVALNFPVNAPRA